MKDPLFGIDSRFYVFRLPFLTFVVDWILASLLAIIIFTAVFHYLNGGIRAARVTPRVTPGVKVHLSVLLALLALAKAAGYLIATLAHGDVDHERGRRGRGLHRRARADARADAPVLALPRSPRSSCSSTSGSAAGRCR